MGSQSVEIMRQGIWASLTGGWYYDPHQNVFCNTFHLYLWLYLVCVPFCVYLYATWWWLGWLSHLVVLAIVSAGIKGVNYLLHHMFDTGECFEEEIIPETPLSEPFRASGNSQNVTAGHQRTSSFEAMEMQVVRTRETESDTPPVGCSSRNSIMEASCVTQPPAVIDLKVDVHHKESSSGSEEGSLKKEKKDGREILPDCQLSSTDCQVTCNEPTLNGVRIQSSLSVVESSSLDGCVESSALKDHLKIMPSTSTLGQVDMNNSSSSSSAKIYYQDENLNKRENERLVLYGLQDRSYRLDSTQPSKSIDLHSQGRPLTSRSCRATPDSLVESPITGERSCSEPSCYVEEIDADMLHQRLHYGSTSRHKERRPRRREESKIDNKKLYHSKDKSKCLVSDPDTEEEVGGAKSSISPLLNIQPCQDLSCKSRKSKSSSKSSKVYHPLVCRATSVAKASTSSSFNRDAVKVTTLTFENIYADDESSSDTPSIVKFSSKSDDEINSALEFIEKVKKEANSPHHQQTDRNEGITVSTLQETHISRDKSVVLENNNTLDIDCQKIGNTDIVGSSLTLNTSNNTEEKDSSRIEDLVDEDEALSELSNNSSCPDIDWLFYHSESDSEFTNVVKRRQFNNANQNVSDDDETDSWNVVRSSPECNSDLVDDPKPPNLRDPENNLKHGAIPKQRRQGLVVGECEDLSQDNNGGREAAGVTMDLVRKMLDVFSSYPENRPRDIKKLLVLVSLEQDRRGTRANEANNSEKEQPGEPLSPEVDEEDTPTLSPSDTIHSISTLTSLKESSSDKLISSNSYNLHRKPAVRRRRPLQDNVSNSEPTTFNSDNSVCVEFSLNSKNNQAISKLHNDYQAALSGTMSFFGNSDDENSINGETEQRKMKKCSKKSFAEDPIVPLSAFGALGAPAIHLASCHDDTSNGAVHCFQDERGHWFTYTFNNSGINIASAVMPVPTNQHLQRSLHRTTDLQSLAEAHRNQQDDSERPAIATGDASLSSSSMSLCSGLTVVLDNQGPSSPMSIPWPDSLKIPKDLRSSHSATPIATSSGTQRRISPPTLLPHLRGDEVRRGAVGGIGLMERHMQRNRSIEQRRMSSSSGPSISRNPREYIGGPGHLHLLNLGTPSNPLQLFTNALFDRRRLSHRMHPSISITHNENYGRNFPVLEDDLDLGIVKQLKFTSPAPQTVQYYKLKLMKNKSIKIPFDRLSLLALLDRNLTILESFFNILLIVCVGILGCLVLFKGYYHEFNVFIFCVVMASCQYSLFKSVQPDAASPTHGYNHIILYSRPVYFCLCCSVVLALDFYLNSGSVLPSFHLYNMELTSTILLTHLRDFLLIFMLFFPVIFSLGLLPQINTFFMYLLEQIDIHVFGGNATTSLTSAVYCVLRSIFTVLFLLGFAYGGLTEKSGSQHILYSIFCALIVAFGYHLSRSAANPSVLWQLIKKHMWPEELLKHYSSNEENVDEDTKDPLPEKLRVTVTNRLMHDAIVCSLIALIVGGVHSSTVFTVLLQGKFPDLLISIWIIASVIGLLNHYIIPQLRTQQPWMCIARPACMSHEYLQFEVYDAAKVMWFEKMYLWLCIIEKNIIYPVLFLCALTKDASTILERHPTAGTFMIVVCGLKCLRSVYSQPQFQYLIVAFTILFFNWDQKGLSESFLIDYFFMSIIFNKMYEFLLKLKFIVTYIAPWQITWGSAFHAFAQPFSVPHSAMLFIQAAISSILSTPLNPILGSAIFVTSYVRPVKFWERDYNTKRMDQSNTRLSSLLEQNPGADDNNLNSIFYEHLTRSLQHSLCGDLTMGRWGPAVQGDCFVLASDNLNCLVHIIEVGNGLVTFQVRGLEFRGTYCQQREVEAISEGVEEDGGCCCCEPGHLPHLLSANAAFNQRWLAWEVTATKYVLEGYSISDNSATSMFQMFELRKILITYYVKSIIFYTIQSAKLEEWLDNEEILASLEHLKEKKFADLDPTFHIKIDEDFDFKDAGITRNSFCNVYIDWISFCLMKRLDRPLNASTNRDSVLVSLCLALSLLGRRALGPSSQCDNVEVFLQFLHSLFKGDIRPTCIRDEWVFADMELLRKIVAPAVRMSLKLHQDHFLLPDEYDSHDALYNAILEHQNQLVICHEGDPTWRAAILAGRPSLLSLRHVNDDGEDKFKIIMLNKRHLLFRVIKINRECVRGLWAGQQQELVYLRNRNPERGSIQNAKQALRNIINSSCDQPIGYPIYVSPLTTSYTDTHDQYCNVTGSTLTPTLIKDSVINFCNRLRERCVEGCSSGSSGLNDECIRPPDSFQNNLHLHQVLSNVPLNSHLSQDGSPIGGFALMTSPTRLSFGTHHSHSSRGSLQANRGSIMSTVSSNLAIGHMTKHSSSTLASLSGLLGDGKQLGGAESEGGSITSKEWSGGRDFHQRMGDSAKDRGSVHNSRDSLSYSAHHSLVWDANGICEIPNIPRAEKRGRGENRGSSVSGITFLSREVVSSGPLDPEWEMGGYLDRGQHTTGSVHSLHSVTPHSGVSHSLTPSVGSYSPITQIISPPSPHCSIVPITICGNSHSPISHCSSSHSPISHCRISHSPIPHCSSSHSPIPHCGSSHSIISPCTSNSQVSSLVTSHSSAQVSDPPLMRSFHSHHSKHQQRHQNLPQEKNIKHTSHSRRVRIIDANQVYDTLNLGRRIDVQWPDEWMRSRGGRSFWGHWVPLEGMEGMVVHSWMPYHPDPKLRSHVDKTILLVQIDDKFVPVAKGAVKDIQSTEQS